MGSNNTSVKVTLFSTGAAATILTIVGLIWTDAADKIPLGYEAALMGMISAITGWITPDPND